MQLIHINCSVFDEIFYFFPKVPTSLNDLHGFEAQKTPKSNSSRGSVGTAELITRLYRSVQSLGSYVTAGHGRGPLRAGSWHCGGTRGQGWSGIWHLSHAVGSDVIPAGPRDTRTGHCDDYWPTDPSQGIPVTL